MLWIILYFKITRYTIRTKLEYREGSEYFLNAKLLKIIINLFPDNLTKIYI